MNEIVTTLVLLFLALVLMVIARWAIAQSGISSAGANPGADPNALSADRRDYFDTR